MAVVVGEMRMWGGAAAPSQWLLCNGVAVSRVTYANLFALIGITFGAGDGATTFNLPDLRNRVWAAVGSNVALAANEGVAEAARLPDQHTNSGGTTGLTNIALDHALSTMAGAASAATQGVQGGGGPQVADSIHTHDTVAPFQWTPPAAHAYNHDHPQGNTAALANWPPNVAVNYIIHAGV